MCYPKREETQKGILNFRAKNSFNSFEIFEQLLFAGPCLLNIILVLGRLKRKKDKWLNQEYKELEARRFATRA